MKRIFADTHYWVALGNRNDQWFHQAAQIGRRLGQVMLVTTEEVLTEFLTYYSGFGKETRMQSAETVRTVLSDAAVQVVQQSHQTFLDGLALYEARPDKLYSMTDCISMVTMRREGIAEVLTHDEHFTQEGFTNLL